MPPATRSVLEHFTSSEPPNKRVKRATTSSRGPLVHPSNVKPAGNAFLDPGPSTRTLTLGSLAVLSDELIMHILSNYDLTHQEIARLSAVSTGLRAFANADSLWKNMFVELGQKMESWQGSWKMTCLAHVKLKRQSNSQASPDGEVGWQDEALQGKRPRLADFIPTRPFYSDFLYHSHRLALVPMEHFAPSTGNPVVSIPREPSTMSSQDFHSRYAALNRPVIIEAGKEKERPRSIGMSVYSLASEKRPDSDGSPFAVQAEAIKTSLTAYGAYSACQTRLSEQIGKALRESEVDDDWNDLHGNRLAGLDEAPFYCFDSELPSDLESAWDYWWIPPHLRACPASCYNVPTSCDGTAGKLTPQQRSRTEADLFSLLESRPDYRWVIAGPTRSGSGWHKDPNYTSAWNTPMTGSKLWMMLPPDTIPPGVFVSEDGADITTPVSLIEWLVDFYEETKKLHGPRGDRKLVEGVCHQGETVYVPSGWWHLVVNLEESLAYTQNLVSLAELPNVLHFMKSKVNQISGFRFSGRDVDEEEEEDTAAGEDPRSRLYSEFVAKIDEYDPAIASWTLERVATLEEEEQRQNSAKLARERAENGAIAGRRGGTKRETDGEDKPSWWDRLRGDTKEEAGRGSRLTLALGGDDDEELEDVPW